MEIVGERLRTLREGVGISQAKLAKLADTNQPSVNRYEKGVTDPTLEMLLWYADYFDVSLDYIFGRIDQPQGKNYDYEPEILKKQLGDKKQIEEFIEFCFEPGSAGNEKLKKALVEMLGGKPTEKKKPTGKK